MAKRVVFILIAFLFLFTSLGFSILVIWSMHKQSKQSAQQSQQSQNTQSKGAKLQGTQLSGFTPQSSIPTLQTQDLTVGTGVAEAKPTDTVTVNYTGAVAATGIIFQSSLDSGQPVAFPLNQVIKGWTEGIPGMKVGGKRRLLIPAADAYGSNPPPGSGIPANADLVFDVDLIKIGQ
jgi:FKBP-type peptidyl-prolyl cis-trans isomerase